jgi:hypothetical protein
MTHNGFASHIDLLLYVYGALVIFVVAFTLWRARKRKRAAARDE